MAKSSGIGDRLYFEGIDVSGDVGSIQTIGGKKATLDVPGLPDAAMSRIGGLGDGQLSFNSWFNDGAGADRSGAALSSFKELSDLRTGNVHVMYARGATLGNECAFLVAKQFNHDANRGQDGSLAFSVDCQAAAGSPLEWGKQLTAGKVTIASSGVLTGIVEAQSTYGGVGFLEHFGRVSGTPTYIIEDSDDTTTGADGTWGTLLTFTGTGGATPFGERKEVTGTVEKGLRVKTTGTFSNAQVAVGFRRGTAVDDKSLA